MATFTIDSDNNIAAHAGSIPASAANLQTFTSEKELAKLASGWPASRLMEVWNSFAGVTPFDDLKPVRKFTDRKQGIARIWRAVARLSPLVAPRVAAGTRASVRAAQLRNGPGQPTSKKAEVIGLMKRARGVTLAEIVAATGWRKHTVRGFVSILAHRGGQPIESAKNAEGERIYRIVKQPY